MIIYDNGVSWCIMVVYLFFLPSHWESSSVAWPMSGILWSTDLVWKSGGFQGLAASSTSKLRNFQNANLLYQYGVQKSIEIYSWCTQKPIKPGCPKHGQAGGSQAAALSRKFHCRRNSRSWRLSPQVSKKNLRQSISGFNYGKPKNTLQD